MSCTCSAMLTSVRNVQLTNYELRGVQKGLTTVLGLWPVSEGNLFDVAYGNKREATRFF